MCEPAANAGSGRSSAATSAKERTSSASSRTACTRTLSSPIGVPLRGRPIGARSHCSIASATRCRLLHRRHVTAIVDHFEHGARDHAPRSPRAARAGSTRPAGRRARGSGSGSPRSTAPASGRASSASICAANWSGVCRSIMSRIALHQAGRPQAAPDAPSAGPRRGPSPACRCRARAPAARSRAARSLSPPPPAGSGRQPVSSSASRSTRCGARRTISSATRPPIECPASAKDAGAVASTRSAIAPRLESGPRLVDPAIGERAEARNAPASHAARSQTRPGNSSERAARTRREGVGPAFRRHGRCDSDASPQARFTARGVR